MFDISSAVEFDPLSATEVPEKKEPKRESNFDIGSAVEFDPMSATEVETPPVSTEPIGPTLPTPPTLANNATVQFSGLEPVTPEAPKKTISDVSAVAPQSAKSLELQTPQTKPSLMQGPEAPKTPTTEPIEMFPSNLPEEKLKEKTPFDYQSALPEVSKAEKIKQSTWTKAVNAFKAGDKQAVLDQAILEARSQGLPKEKILEMADQYEKDIQTLRPEKTTASDFILSTIGGFLPDLARSFTSGAQGQAAGALLSEIPGVNIGVGLARTAGAVEYWREKGDAQAYLAALKNGVDENTAKKLAVAVSIPVGLLAEAQVSKFIPSGAKNAAQKAITQRAMQAFANYADKTVDAAILGAATEATQATGEEIGKALIENGVPENKIKRVMNVVNRSKDAFLQSLPEMAVMSVGHLGKSALDISRDRAVDKLINQPSTLHELGHSPESYLEAAAKDSKSVTPFDKLTPEDQNTVVAEYNRQSAEHKAEQDRLNEMSVKGEIPGTPLEEVKAEAKSEEVKSIEETTPSIENFKEASASPESEQAMIDAYKEPIKPVEEAKTESTSKVSAKKETPIVEAPMKPEEAIPAKEPLPEEPAKSVEMTIAKTPAKQVAKAKAKVSAQKANYDKAIELGYKPKGTEKVLGKTEISTPEEAQSLNDLSKRIEDAHIDSDIIHPEELGKIVTEYESNFKNKIDDPVVDQQIEDIKQQLKDDGFSKSGKPLSLSHLLENESYDNAKLTLEAREEALLRDNPEYSVLKGKARRDEINRIAKQARGEKPAPKTDEEAEYTLTDQELVKRNKTLAALKKKQNSALARVAEAQKEKETPILNKVPVKKAPEYGKDFWSKSKNIPDDMGKSPEAVQKIWDKTLKHFYGDNQPKNVSLEISDKRKNGEAWGEHDEGEFTWNEDGSATVRLRKGLSADRIKQVITHEVVGHFSLTRVIGADKNLFGALYNRFQADRKLAESGKAKTDVFDLYGGDHYENIREQHGKIEAERHLFEEWLAKQVENKNPTVVGTIKNFFIKTLRKLGLATRDSHQEEIDRLINDVLGKIKEQRDMVEPREARENISKAIEEAQTEPKVIEAPPKKIPETPEEKLNAIHEHIYGKSRTEVATVPDNQVKVPFNSFEHTDESVKNMLNRKWLDKFSELERVQGEIKGAGKDIQETSDAYLAQEIMQSRTKTDLEHFEKNYYEPLKHDIAKSGMNLREIGLYLYARHAKERNAQKAKENPKFNEDMMFNGRMQKRPGSGMFDSTADAIIREFSSDPRKMEALNKIEQQMRKIENYHQHLLVKSGLIDQATVDKYNTAYKNYIPLKGFQPEDLIARKNLTPEEIANLEHDELGRATDKEIEDLQKKFKASSSGGAKGFSVTRKSKRASGRSTLADVDQILANRLADVSNDIITAHKNEVGQTFLNLVRENPNPKVWEIVDKVPTKPYFNERLGRFVEGPDPSYRKDPSIMFVKENGKEVAIRINDPALMNAMKNMGAENTNVVLRAMGTFNRYLANLITRYSPEFVSSNLMRDVQESMMNISAEDGKMLAGKTAKQIPAAIKGMYGYLRGKQETEWQQWAHEFSKEGGRVEFLNFNDVEQTQKKLMSDIGRLNGSKKDIAIGYFKNILDRVDEVNSSVENGTRLSYYKTLRENGVSPKYAAQKAKNLTVNFNRRGEYGQVLNTAYLFANAAMQGTARMAKMLKTPTGKAFISSLVGAGLMSSKMNRAIAGDENYEKIPIWVRNHNWIIMRPDGSYYKFPLPFNVGVFYAAGTTFDAVAHKTITPMEGASQLATGVWDSFNPLGGGTFLQTITPTMIRPVTDIAMNKDFAGRPIYDQSVRNQFAPASQQYKPGQASAASIAITNKLHEAFGGTKFKESPFAIAEVNPAVLDYVTKSLTGSLGDMLMKTGSIAVRAEKGLTGQKNEPLTSRDIPFVRRFHGDADTSVRKGLLTKTKDEMETVNKEYKALLETDQDAAKQFMAEHKNEIQAYHLSQSTSSAIMGLNKAIKQAQKQNNTVREEALKKQIDNSLERWYKKMDELGTGLVRDKQ